LKTVKAVAVTVSKGYLSIDLPPLLRSVVVRSNTCGSGILSFYGRFLSVLLSGVKTETRRLWSSRTPTAARYLFRMRTAFEKRLFVRTWCGGKLVGWGLLTGWDTQTLGSIDDNDLQREGYGGKTRKEFLETEFNGLPSTTLVLVVTFVLYPSVVG
jgi:hypothetical protein